MSRKKISTTIYVTPEQSERLRLLHERTKVPVAVYIREGIDLVLRQYGHLLPGQLPLAAESAVPSPRIPTLPPPSALDGDDDRTAARADRSERADRAAAASANEQPLDRAVGKP
jgi:hypothetical protein